MDKLYIPVILATAREGRQSEYAARFVHQRLSEKSLDTEFIDVATLPSIRTVPSWEESDEQKRGAEWSQTATRADGFIIVTPEYNRGYPGELKLFLDRLYKEYNRKPVGICGVSTGIFGGARVVEALRLVAIELQMVPMRQAVYFSNVADLFDEQHNMKAEQYDGYVERVDSLCEELIWYAKALKQAREGL
jgi:NAD(P)H-dependent FMN reductase